MSPEATWYCPDKSLRYTACEGIRRGEVSGFRTKDSAHRFTRPVGNGLAHWVLDPGFIAEKFACEWILRPSEHWSETLGEEPFTQASQVSELETSWCWRQEEDERSVTSSASGALSNLLVLSHEFSSQPYDVVIHTALILRMEMMDFVKPTLKKRLAFVQLTRLRYWIIVLGHIILNPKFFLW